MISLLISFAVLLIGYIVYGRVTQKVFSPDDRKTPAIAVNDGVDCVPLKTWKAFLIQLLNIAGTGPIFGALMGAVSGFHATQSPMIAKCIRSEKVGRTVFYGAMISEAVIALVWAAAGVSFYGTTQLLSEALKSGASNVVYEISTGVLGAFGGTFAVALFAVYCILWARSRRSGRTNIQTEEVNGNEP